MSSLSKRFLVTGGLLGAALLYAAPASAQATRTWVSGVGDDVNPCSRTAPCKTFAGAISKTAAGGEINCLDPAGWGAVSITKSITIDCTQYPGGILNSGTNGIVINAGVNDVVTIRGMEINGSSTGVNGVRFLAGGALTLEDVTISGNAQSGAQGISFQPGNAAKLFLRRVTISNNGNGSTGGGVLIQPTGASGSATAVLEDVTIIGNANGAFKIDTTGNTAAAGVTAVITDSNISGNPAAVAVVTPAGTTSATLTIVRTTVANSSLAGLIANGATATIQVSESTITGNANALLAVGGGTINSFGDNLLQGNSPNGSFTAVLPKN